MRDGIAKPVRQVAESEGTILNKTTFLMTLITILSAIGSALAISNLITASVIERSQELGLLKALGALNAQIILFVLTEVMLIGFAGGVVGYFLGIGFAQVIGRTVFGSGIEIAPSHSRHYNHGKQESHSGAERIDQRLKIIVIFV